MRQDGGQRRGRVHRGPLILGLAALVTALTLGCAGIAVGAVGGLTYEGCITGEETSGPQGSGACATISSATADGQKSGLHFVRSLALSPDDKFLYAASEQDAAVAHFKRDPATGALRYRGCVTGSKQTGPTGSGACNAIPNPTSFGIHSG